MKKYILIGTLIVSSLTANDRISQLKAAIVRSDDQVVKQLLTQGALSAKDVYELCGWADDLIEERRLGGVTRGEDVSFVLGSTGLGVLVVGVIGYIAHDAKFINLLKLYYITTDKRAALCAVGCTALCLYGIKRGSYGVQRRLNKAYAIKDVLEQQLVLHRKEKPL